MNKKLLFGLIIFTLFNAGVAISSYANKKKINNAVSDGVAIGSTVTCWKLTYVGNEKCDEIATALSGQFKK
jgi:tryptophan synthase alpha subunit